MSLLYCNSYDQSYNYLFVFAGSKRISDSEISDYDCDDGIGVVSGKTFIDVFLKFWNIFHDEFNPLSSTWKIAMLVSAMF